MMASKSISMARWLSLTASAASFLFTAGAAQAQTSRDPLEFPAYEAGAPRTADPNVERRPPAQSLTIQPRIGVRAMVTDNVYLTSSNHQTDLVTNAFAGASVRAAGPRSFGRLDLDVGYDSYSRAHQLNGWTYTGFGVGEYDIVRQFLLFEANGAVTNGSVSSFGVPARDRSGVGDRTRIVNIAAGPRLTTTIGDTIDLSARALGGWVGYEADDANTSTLPQDTTFRQASVAATTGSRYASHQLTANASYQADDSDFRMYTGLVSLFVPVGQNFRLLARGGVDDIRETGVIDIQAPIWSVGFEYELNPTSYIRIEGGRRYHENNFAADSRIDLTDRFYFTGRYLERILPAQLALGNDFLGFISDSQTLAPPLVDTNFDVRGPLFSETSRDKLGLIRGVYTWPDQELGLSASWIQRRLLSSSAEEEYVDATVAYMRRMRPDLRGELSVTYGRYLGDANRGSNRRWSGAATLVFVLNPSVEITGGYAYSNDKQTTVGGERLIENVAFASITKTF